VNTNLLQEEAEKALAEKLTALASIAAGHLAKAEYRQALASLAGLRDPVDRFFDEVMVNAEDPALRDNRLNLLRQLSDQFLQVADIAQLVVGK
jgi:glycyl-tRNA synthetase beta chain